jgi:hypothetical protein
METLPKSAMTVTFTPRSGVELDDSLAYLSGPESQLKVIPHSPSGRSSLPILTKRDFENFKKYCDSKGLTVPDEFTFQNYLKKFWACIFSLIPGAFINKENAGMSFICFFLFYYAHCSL